MKILLILKTDGLNIKKKTVYVERSIGRKLLHKDKVPFYISTFSEVICDSSKPGIVECLHFTGSIFRHKFYLRKGNISLRMPTERAYCGQNS